MAQYPVLLTSSQPQHTTPTIQLSSTAPRALTPRHHILFAQRLAILIKRVRAATKEGNANEQ
jgi:hypothetical protein